MRSLVSLSHFAGRELLYSSLNMYAPSINLLAFLCNVLLQLVLKVFVYLQNKNLKLADKKIHLKKRRPLSLKSAVFSNARGHGVQLYGYLEENPLFIIWIFSS